MYQYFLHTVTVQITGLYLRDSHAKPFCLNHIAVSKLNPIGAHIIQTYVRPIDAVPPAVTVIVSIHKLPISIPRGTLVHIASIAGVRKKPAALCEGNFVAKNLGELYALAVPITCLHHIIEVHHHATAALQIEIASLTAAQRHTVL